MLIERWFCKDLVSSMGHLSRGQRLGCFNPSLHPQCWGEGGSEEQGCLTQTPSLALGDTCLPWGKGSLHPMRGGVWEPKYPPV